MFMANQNAFAQSEAGAPPKSDVSAVVGLVGLVGLFAWVMFCRYFGDIAQSFDWNVPHQPLSGGYSAVIALLFTALPMVLWSVFVDKVHRNPSTGLDWDNPKSWAADFKTSAVKIFGLWATFALLTCFYVLARWYWNGNYQFAMKVLGGFALPIALLTLPYVLWIDRYLKAPRDYAWHFGAMLLGQKGWDMKEVKKHARAWAIKGFFSAFMISILPGGFHNLVEYNFAGIWGDPVRLAKVCFDILFLIDVQIGTVGYLLTMRPLDAHIRSGNPFFAGWVAALICYPPVASAFMGQKGMIHYEVGTKGWDFWMAGDGALLYIWGALLVLLVAVYAWATMAFGIRFSNLTYRGVITNGPYRFTRHPAYFSKNLFWWLSTLPFLVTTHSALDAIRNTLFLACVSGIYYWRAKTEEAHLSGEDEKYRAYYAWMEERGWLTIRLKKLGGFFRKDAA